MLSCFDEAVLSDRYVNKQNFRIWARENLQEIHKYPLHG